MRRSVSSTVSPTATVFIHADRLTRVVLCALVRGLDTPYQLTIRAQAAKTLRKMPRAERDRVRTALRRLAQDPDSAELDVRRLHGRTGFRPRVGDRRLIVERDDAARTMDVLRIGRRGDVYKR